MTFLIAAVLLAFVAAGQVSAARSEELDGRLDPLLARPVARTRWLVDRVLAAVAALVACAVVSGLATAAGAAAGGAHVDAWSVMGAGLNTVPPATCVLGIGVLAYGFAPRAAGIVVYAVVTWSVFVDLVGGIGSLNHWVADTSVFRQMADAPAVPPDWRSMGVLLGVGRPRLRSGARPSYTATWSRPEVARRRSGRRAGRPTSRADSRLLRWPTSSSTAPP